MTWGITAGVVVGAVGVFLYEVYSSWCGCSGGHVWGEWEDARRLKGIPCHSGRRIGVQWMMERQCQCEDCDATEERWNNPHMVDVGERVVIENTEDGVEVRRP